MKTKKTKKEHEVWTMPAWMETYRDLFQNTGGNSIEELVNDRDPHMMFNNQLRYILKSSVIAQVDLLNRMARRGMLKGVDPSWICE